MTIEIINRETGRVERVPLQLAEDGVELQLGLAPGASAVQLVVREEDVTLAAIEVPGGVGEIVKVQLSKSEDGGIRAVAKGKGFLILPEEAPAPPLLELPASGNELDLVVLVDGTCLHPKGEVTTEVDYLLGPSLKEEWSEVVKQIAEFAASIAKRYPNVWTSVLAFGDEDTPLLLDPQLKPLYSVFPRSADDRNLIPTTSAQVSSRLTQELLRLPHSPGGDFVDALADGLKACGEMRWRQGARKLVLLFGQSPGYSVLVPPDELTNLLTRRVCIEEEVNRLHEDGVELMTIFHRPPQLDDRYRVNMPELIDHAQRQYEGLASLPQWSAVSPPLDVAKLADLWLNPPKLIARGPSPGFQFTS